MSLHSMAAIRIPQHHNYVHGEQKGHYQELKLEKMDKKQFETLHGGQQAKM